MRRQRLVAVLVFAAAWSAAPADALWPDDPTVNLAVSRADGSQQTYPASAVGDGVGGAIIVWIKDLSSSPDLWAQRVSVNGEILWPGDGVPVTTAPGTQSEIRVVEDGVGGAIVVWRDHRGSDYDYWAQRIDRSGQVLWPTGSPSLDGVPVCTVAGDQEAMEAVSDGAGGVIVAWLHDDPVIGGIYAQRLDADGQRLWPTGSPADTGAVVSDQYLAFDPSVTGDGVGGVIIAWADTRGATTELDIYAQRLDANGVRQWATDGVPVCVEDYGQRYSVITSDGSGGAVVAWQDYRTPGSYLGIYAQRLDADGNILWTPEGVVINETIWAGDWVLGIAGNGSGGAYVVWVDVRTEPDIYAQRLNALGQTVWVPGGAPVVQAPQNQSSFDLVSDGPDGVFVAWPDPRNGNLDIYAQHLGSDGSPTGPDNGVEVCTHPDGQGGPSAVAGGGGLVVAWYDTRNLATTGTDIYAHRVFGSGLLFSDGFESGDTGAWFLAVP